VCCRSVCCGSVCRGSVSCGWMCGTRQREPWSPGREVLVRLCYPRARWRPHAFHQVTLDELPWATPFLTRRQGDAAKVAARDAFVLVVSEVMAAFPYTIMPNKLLQSLQELVEASGLEIPLVNEVCVWEGGGLGAVTPVSGAGRWVGCTCGWLGPSGKGGVGVRVDAMGILRGTPVHWHAWCVCMSASHALCGGKPDACVASTGDVTVPVFWCVCLCVPVCLLFLTPACRGHFRRAVHQEVPAGGPDCGGAAEGLSVRAQRVF
jgi:hypothetical protein